VEQSTYDGSNANYTANILQQMVDTGAKAASYSAEETVTACMTVRNLDNEKES
jgi:hypothetical protein